MSVTGSVPNSNRQTIAVVLAGGSGSRFGLNVPKQLLKVAGRTLLEHTVETLASCPEIDNIIVMMASDHIAEAERLLLGNSRSHKLLGVLPGGNDRNESTRAALAALGDQECNVIIHDAVRPLVPASVISECVEALRTYHAVDVAVASADTIIRIDEDNLVVDIPDRSWLRRGQTPQGFRLSTIRRAYELAESDPDFRATDDCGVVLRYLPDVPIYVVEGDEQNMKVTYPIDLYLIDKLFQLGSRTADPLTESERRAALRDQVVVVIGGSYGIGKAVMNLAERTGCRAYSLSRSATGTYVERPSTVIAALERIARAAGRIDHIVLCAAQLATGTLVGLTDDEIVQQINVNLVGPVTVARAGEPYLRQGGGHLVLFTSSSYTHGRSKYALYSATKAAVVNLAQALADEWSESGVHVNVVNPERTRTPMRRAAFGDERAETLLDPAAVASTVVDLLASQTTGHVIDIRLSQPETERPSRNGPRRVAINGLAPQPRTDHRERRIPHRGV